MGELYTVSEVAGLLGIAPGRLRSWARSGLCPPSERRGRTRLYTFQDLVGLRAARRLLDAGVSPQKLRRATDALRRLLPRSCSPLAALRVYSEAHAVVACENGRSFEAESGQLLLDFAPVEEQSRVVQMGEARAAPPERADWTAMDWYLEGCRLDQDPRAIREGEEAYLRAIEIDPLLACAYTNLGNLRYRLGAEADARALYQKAIEIEPDQPEGHYNLGYLTYEDGLLSQAASLFRRALELDPGFGDAHFNLAMTLAELGHRSDARRHFAAYLELEPQGPWSDLARRHL